MRARVAGTRQGLSRRLLAGLAVVLGIAIGLALGLAVPAALDDPNGDARQPSDDVVRLIAEEPARLFVSQSDPAFDQDLAERYAWALTEVDWSGSQAREVSLALLTHLDRYPAGSPPRWAEFAAALSQIDPDAIHPDLRAAVALGVARHVDVIHSALTATGTDGGAEGDADAAPRSLSPADAEAVLRAAGSDAAGAVTVLEALATWLPGVVAQRLDRESEATQESLSAAMTPEVGTIERIRSALLSGLDVAGDVGALLSDVRALAERTFGQVVLERVPADDVPAELVGPGGRPVDLRTTTDRAALDAMATLSAQTGIFTPVRAVSGAFAP